MEIGDTMSGAANSFDRRFLEDNLVGQKFKGSKCIRVSNKYIVTEDNKYLKKGLHITFDVISTETYYSPKRRD